VKRREFISLLGGAAAAWPLAARAQQDRESAGQMPRVGWLWSGRSAGSPSELAGFQQGLRELGYVEGKNIVVEYRFGENSTERLHDLASDLAGLKLNLILALGTPSAKAAQQAAPTSPIIFMSGDPLSAGLVTSLGRPSGNLTGLSVMTLSEKWPDLAQELLPEPHRLLVESKRFPQLGEFQSSATFRRGVGAEIWIIPGRAPRKSRKCIRRNGGRWCESTLARPSHPYPTNWPVVAQLALKHKLPAISELREFVTAGGLMSYGASVFDSTRRMAHYMDKILKGTKPTDLPVEQPTRFELAINLKTAKALGLTVPDNLLARADEVIE
jgi:putative tryptophan/tyrosine transport system substrate-binding protein